MSHSQNTNEEIRVPEESAEAAETPDGMCDFLDAVAKSMLEKHIKEYYSKGQRWDPSSPQSKVQSI